MFKMGELRQELPTTFFCAGFKTGLRVALSEYKDKPAVAGL
jgi:hypothetical protein